MYTNLRIFSDRCNILCDQARINGLTLLYIGTTLKKNKSNFVKRVIIINGTTYFIFTMGTYIWNSVILVAGST